jgi:hypothetical protein
MSNIKKWACAFLPLLITTGVQAEEMTSHGSHVHGEAAVTFVLDGNEAEVALVTAAGNVVGFEHQPKTADEQKKLQQQLQMLRSGDWFVVDAAAGCQVSGHEVRSEQEDAHQHGHADIYANLQLLCQHPQKLKQLHLRLTELATGVEKVKLQWLIDGEAGAAELTTEKNKQVLR